MGYEFTFEMGGDKIIESKVVDMRARRPLVDPILKEQAEIEDVKMKLWGFISREEGTNSGRNAPPSIKDRIGGLVSGLFGKHGVSGGVSSKVVLAKECLARLGALGTTVESDLRTVSSAVRNPLPNQRLDSLYQIRKDVYGDPRATHELKWVLGAKEPVEEMASNEAPTAKPNDAPEHRFMSRNTVDNPGPSNVVNLTRARTMKELSGNGQTVPSARAPRSPYGAEFHATTVRAEPAAYAPRAPAQIDPAKAAELTRLQQRNAELVEMDTRLQTQISQLENASFFSRVGSFLKGASTSSQIASLKAERDGVARRFSEIERKITAIKKYDKEVAA